VSAFYSNGCYGGGGGLFCGHRQGQVIGMSITERLALVLLFGLVFVMAWCRERTNG